MGINGVKYANTIYAAKDGPLDAKSLAPNYESLKSESYWGDLANGKPYIKNGEVKGPILKVNYIYGESHIYGGHKRFSFYYYLLIS